MAGPSTPSYTWEATPIFRDRALDAAFKRNGFVVIPLLGDESIQRLRDGYEQLADKPDSPFHTGLPGTTYEFKRESHELIVREVATLAMERLVEFRPLIGTFMAKQPANDSAMWTHRDWSIVDARKSLSVNFWCPLCDSDATNGAVCLVPGSHRDAPIWGSGFPSMANVLENIPENAFHQPRIPCGWALVMNQGLVHRSGPNQSPTTRVATSLALIPQKAEAVHYAWDQDTNRINVWRIDTEFFLQYAFDGAPLPETLKLVATIAPPQPFGRRGPSPRWTPSAGARR